jgi:hypothetical protein
MPNVESNVLQVRNRHNIAVIYVSDSSFEVLECSNNPNCRIQGVKGSECPIYCPFIVDAKRYLQGMKTKYRVEVLNPVQ